MDLLKFADTVTSHTLDISVSLINEVQFNTVTKIYIDNIASLSQPSVTLQHNMSHNFSTIQIQSVTEPYPKPSYYCMKFAISIHI